MRMACTIGLLLVPVTSLAAQTLRSQLEKDFGTTLLAPAAGVRSYGSISSARWQVSPAPAEAIGAVVGGGGLGGFLALRGHVAADAARSNNAVAALLDLGVAFRAVGGDIASATHKTDFDNTIGGSKMRLGLELGLQLAVNGAKAGLTCCCFGGDVPGLSRGQVVAGFSVQSALFEGDLKPGR
jgi:hypothetical protein